MIKIIDIKHSFEWDNIVKSFAEYDIYYMLGYVGAFQIHGDGRPQLMYYAGFKGNICVYAQGYRH